MCCSVRHSELGDGCKSIDNMTFSLTDNGQEGRYYELLAQLCAGVTLWLEVDADVFFGFPEPAQGERYEKICQIGGKKDKIQKRVEDAEGEECMERWEARRWEETGSRGIQMRVEEGGNWWGWEGDDESDMRGREEGRGESEETGGKTRGLGRKREEYRVKERLKK